MRPLSGIGTLAIVVLLALAIAAVLLALRNPDLSWRRFPLPLGANLPELDVPAWWLLGRKQTMYYDGRTDARSVRTNMQFLLARVCTEEATPRSGG